jgi:O-antigen/teichoic acid export membrane protein
MLPLETFGYYSVAATVASGLLYLMAPISLTLLPRFTELLAKKQHDDLVRTYHVSAQLMAVVLTPVALVLAMFSHEVIALWTHSASIAQRTSTVAAILVMAMLLFTLVDIPYMLQLAQGRARLAVYTNLASVALYVPMLAVLVPRYGLIGGAVPLLVLYAAKLVIWAPLMHSVILPGEWARWFFGDVARPVVATATVTIVARLLLPRGLFSSFLSGVFLLGIVVMAAAVAAIAAAPLARNRAASLLPLLRDAFSRKPENPPVPTRIDP